MAMGNYLLLFFFFFSCSVGMKPFFFVSSKFLNRQSKCVPTFPKKGKLTESGDIIVEYRA